MVRAWAVEARRARMASAVHNALRQFGQVRGVAVLGAIIEARGPAGFVAGLDAAMWVSGAAPLAAALVVALLVRSSTVVMNKGSQ